MHCPNIGEEGLALYAIIKLMFFYRFHYIDIPQGASSSLVVVKKDNPFFLAAWEKLRARASI
jgi:hypothetical protein